MNQIMMKKMISNTNIKNKEELRFNLYSIYTEYLLSREIYKKNIDLKEFLLKNNWEYKDYVFASRTVIISKVIRNIEKADYDQLKMIYKTIKNELFSELKLSKNKNKRSNDIDDLLNQFGE